MGEVGSKVNAAGSLNEDQAREQGAYLAVNSVQQTIFVERMPDPMRLGAHRDILLYDRDNLYPNKIKTMAQRSQSCLTAIDTETKFITGQGFVDESLNSLVVNDEGQTLKDILFHASNEKSFFKGLAIHFNYNIFGEIIDINEISFETFRYKYDFSKIIFRRDWSDRSSLVKNPQIEYDLFDPEKVIEQINEVGIENYNGQILYWIPKRNEIYPTCNFDQVLDDVQFEHESGLYKLRNIQNDYSAGYMMVYPKSVENEVEKQNIKREQGMMRGSSNAGNNITVPLSPMDLQNLGNFKFIQEIPRTGIDKLFTKQNEETRFNIYAAFQQPPILNGISKDGMFNQESFVDAFDFYNSITEEGRQQIERIFNRFLPFTIWGIDSVEILPLEFISRSEAGDKGAQSEEEAGKIKLEAQASLKGTVGSVDGILAIQEKVAMGVTQYDSGLEILTEIYGFSDEKAKAILGKEKDFKAQPNTKEE